MTEMEPKAQTAEMEDSVEIDPIPVKLVSTESEVPDFGTWNTYSWAAASSLAATAQRILPLDRRRHKARIIVFNGAAAGAGAFVLVGSRGQVQNNQGGQLQPGNYEITNAQELWVGSDGVNAMIVTVLQERYG